jgi:hypothetical protein
MLGSSQIRILGMVEQQNVDEITVERLMGNYTSRLTPGVKQIITAALQKVREKRNKGSDNSSWHSESDNHTYPKETPNEIKKI